MIPIKGGDKSTVMLMRAVMRPRYYYNNYHNSWLETPSKNVENGSFNTTSHITSHSMNIMNFEYFAHHNCPFFKSAADARKIATVKFNFLKGIYFAYHILCEYNTALYMH